MGEILSKLKLGKHYRMERFALLSGVFSVLFIFVVLGCFGSQVAKDANTLTDEAMYSTEFRSSRTGVSGSVDGVYVSQDKTRAFVLGHFEDISKISTDAEDYQMFLTAVDQNLHDQTLKAEPAGAFYVFGSTGYFGTYLVNSEGFEPQILDLTVRCNAEYVTASDVSSSTGDASFAKYDQFAIYFNPGGANAPVSACLSKEATPSPVDLYSEMVIEPQEAALRETLQADEDLMEHTLKRINGRIDAAEKMGIAVGESPVLVGADYFTVNDAGDSIYVCDAVSPGGFDFDWRGSAISMDGYLSSLLGENDTVSSLFARKTQEAKNSPTAAKREWFKTDGSAIADLSGTGEYNDLMVVINDLENAWSEYIEAKRSLQVKDLKELLVLESSLSNIDTMTTINTGENVLRCY